MWSNRGPETQSAGASLARFDLGGETALVTGSTQGIGFTLALGLMQAGATVAINGRDAERVITAADGFRRDGLRAAGFAFDATDSPAVATAIAEIEQEIGPISILVNNAGINRRALFTEQDDEDWSAILSTNLGGVRNVSGPVVRSMIRRGRGKIINVCSLTSEVARPGVSAYAATKGALKMLTRALAVELAPYNIQVNGLGPGYIRTPLNAELAGASEFDQWVLARTPAGRWGTPEDLIGAAIFLASAASDFLTGQVIYVDGGILASL